MLEQPRDLRLPQREARARPDVTATLAALEHEAPRAIAQEQIEQPWRWHVKVGRGALRLERTGLRWPAAGDQRDRRRELADHGELLLANLRRYEAEDPDAPRPVAEQLLGFGEQRAYFFAGHQREREERQPA